ncbi:MAG: putative Geranylgeranyl transferase type-2 subunit beta 2 [Streblomastix strix]|uniref:Geranylgeranyl transferase type-2 subunit beta n=1 Tax=Streblomastix strix TaxID=222440 RepID=A0A5J4WMY9_9EUKA|nr:MAG: putative Geranylgeranyl transferase type-2 subunit beta 2 [Streblomastix strix]
MIRQHIGFIRKLMKEQQAETEETAKIEHMKMNAVYWGLSALDLLNALPLTEERNLIMNKLQKCRNVDGGYGGSPLHDSHILSTLSVIQIAVILGQVDKIDRESINIAGLQNKDGSFNGDKYGEVDTRFSYCACCALSLINKLNVINQEKAVEYLDRCRNWDGGFGQWIDSESHGGQIFCSVGALDILNKINIIEKDKLIWWLSERQTELGGLCGRPEKDPDVCYSWWDLSVLSILNSIDSIDKDKLAGFILKCQDKDKGGISDSVENEPDVYHTFFGLAGLTLLNNPVLERELREASQEITEISDEEGIEKPNKKDGDVNITTSSTGSTFINTINPTYALTHRALRYRKDYFTNVLKEQLMDKDGL